MTPLHSWTSAAPTPGWRAITASTSNGVMRPALPPMNAGVGRRVCPLSACERSGASGVTAACCSTRPKSAISVRALGASRSAVSYIMSPAKQPSARASRLTHTSIITLPGETDGARPTVPSSRRPVLIAAEPLPCGSSCSTVWKSGLLPLTRGGLTSWTMRWNGTPA
eukprot:2075875-Prymnesium_polylepis.2